MRRLILRSFQSPGDILMLTAAVRDLHAAHPGQFRTDVRTSCDALWDHNPHLTRLSERDSGVEQLDMHYPLVHESNQRPYHFIHGYAQYLEQQLGVRIPVTQFRGDVYLTEEERSSPTSSGDPGLPERFWIIVAGGKYDFTAKWWNPASYQRVVDHFRGRIEFVQCGEAGHWHPPLKHVVNLVGKTTPRAFLRLMHHADGVVCPVTFAMHLAAAVPTKPGSPPHRPCVVIAGGREPAHWAAYPQQQFLSTGGALPCCLDGGCWRSRCQLVGDGDPKDRQDVCERPVQVTPDLRIPQCMDMITAEDVIRRIEWYFEGGALHAMNGHAQAKDSLPLILKQSQPAAPPVTREAPGPKTLVLEFPHEFSDTIELSIVLKHLRHYHPDWLIRAEVPEGQQRLLNGLAHPVSANGSSQTIADVERRPLNLPDCGLTMAHSPSTRSARCVFEDFRLSPIEDLFRYEIAVPNEAGAAARSFLSGLCDASTAAEYRVPVVLLDFSDGVLDETISEAGLDELVTLVRDSQHVPVILGARSVASATALGPDHPFWKNALVSPEEFLAGLIQQSALVVGSNRTSLRLAAALSTPAVAVWPKIHPVQEFDLALNVTHLVPESLQDQVARPAAEYFRRHYHSVTYSDLQAVLGPAVREALQHRKAEPREPEPAPRPKSARREKTRPVETSSVTTTTPAVAGTSTPQLPRTFTSVRFIHGLGDCSNFAKLIPLYVRRGHDIGVECTPDKALVFEAAGATVVAHAQHTHDWAYPPRDVHTGHGGDHLGSKIGWNVSEPPLPNIGSKEELWSEYCRSRVRVTARLPESARKFIEHWLKDLPRPVVLLHSKGNTGQGVKSLPDSLAARFYGELLDRFDGSLILLDWDHRVPDLSTYRVRHLDLMPGGCSTERMFALMEAADLVVGVDSGPLHAAGLTDTPRIGVWMPGHYPARYTLPDPNQLNLVLSGPTASWNRYRRLPWNIVEQPGAAFDPVWLAEQVVRMLDPPRYLDREHQAADVQLQQWVREWCRGDRLKLPIGYTDRNRSFDLVLREASLRFDRPTFVETGTIRAEEDWAGAGFSTYLFGSYVSNRQGVLHSVDLDPRNGQFARTWCAPYGDAVSIHEGDSVGFLSRFEQPIDVLYVDSLDTYEPRHAEHALAEVQAALPKLHDRSLVIFDDSPWSQGAFTGKGAMAIPWLLERGWRLLYAGYQAVLGRNGGAA